MEPECDSCVKAGFVFIFSEINTVPSMWNKLCVQHILTPLTKCYLRNIRTYMKSHNHFIRTYHILSLKLRVNRL